MLLAVIWETCSTDQKHEIGRLKHTIHVLKTTWPLWMKWYVTKPQRPETERIVQHAKYPKKRI